MSGNSVNGEAGGRVKPINHSVDNAKDSWAERYSLSLDGGGVRGYSSLLILQKLMDIIEEIEKKEDLNAKSSYYPEEFQESYDSKRLAKQSLSEPGERLKSPSKYFPCHYFDFIAGTSTGGLIAIMLARLRMSVDEALEVFRDMSKDVFSTSRCPVWFPWIYTYNHRKLERVVKGVVDRRILTMVPDWSTKEKAFFSELNGICNCVVVAFGETKQSAGDSPYLFRSYISPQNNDNPLIRNAGVRDHYPIWMVARATSAAPGYLRPMKIEGRHFIDGGFGCNNPSLELWQEINFLYGPAANKFVLSIGTGEQSPSSKFGSTIGILADALRMATNCRKTHEDMQRFLGAGEGAPKYCRFNVQRGMGTIKLGSYRELGNIENLTREYLEDPQVLERLREVAETLVRNRKDRIAQNRDRWEAFCCETRYTCEEGNDHRCQSGYHERTRHRFGEHLQRDHAIVDENERKRVIEESKKRSTEHRMRAVTNVANKTSL